MKNISGINVIESINDILHDSKLSERFYTWQSEKSNDFINEPERAERCHNAAENGADGSLHCEVIDDFREFGAELLREQERAIERKIDEIEEQGTVDLINEQFEECKQGFDAACDELEKWHIANGSYETEIG